MAKKRKTQLPNIPKNIPNSKMVVENDKPLPVSDIQLGSLYSVLTSNYEISKQTSDNTLLTADIIQNQELNQEKNNETVIVGLELLYDSLNSNYEVSKQTADNTLEITELLNKQPIYKSEDDEKILNDETLFNLLYSNYEISKKIEENTRDTSDDISTQQNTLEDIETHQDVSKEILSETEDDTETRDKKSFKKLSEMSKGIKAIPLSVLLLKGAAVAAVAALGLELGTRFANLAKDFGKEVKGVYTDTKEIFNRQTENKQHQVRLDDQRNVMLNNLEKYNSESQRLKDGSLYKEFDKARLQDEFDLYGFIEEKKLSPTEIKALQTHTKLYNTNKKTIKAGQKYFNDMKDEKRNPVFRQSDKRLLELEIERPKQIHKQLMELTGESNMDTNVNSEISLPKLSPSSEKSNDIRETIINEDELNNNQNNYNTTNVVNQAVSTTQNNTHTAKDISVRDSAFNSPRFGMF